MPSLSAAPNKAVVRTVYLFAAVACLLWLLALLSTHAVLFPGGPNFEDILVYKGRFTLYHSKKFFTSHAYSAFAYPAGSAPIYAFLYQTRNALALYLGSAFVAIAVALLTLYLYLRRSKALFLLLPLLTLSFPLVFLVQRANIELYLWSMVATGLLLYAGGRRYAAAILFGLCAATKLYPIFLLGLFLSRKRDLPVFLTGTLAAVLAMCAAIAYAGPSFTIAAHGFFSGVDRFQGHYAQTVRSTEVSWDHCLFSPVKVWSMTHPLSLHDWMLPYYMVAGTLCVALFLRIRRMPDLNRMVFLTAAMVSLPPVSYAYTLTHLMLPTLLLLVALLQNERPPASAKWCFSGLLFLFLPLIALSAVQPFPAGPVQSLVLLFVLLLPSVAPWPSIRPVERQLTPAA
ncbi:MAG: glycosyltransferase family 87 protein [Acidobacteriaceae bacterium]|nr:glycosyltransferase family 87 protein [Acidobacteriaceae bacterium]